MSKATSNARPKRARKDTAKIAPFRAEVQKQKVQRASRKRSKAQCEDYGLDLEEREDSNTEEEEQESDLPDIDEIGPHGDFNFFKMDDSELETVWGNIKQAKKAKKQKLFGKTSKVVDNAPARPAISPKKKRGRSPSPKSTSNKRVRNNVETHKRPKLKIKGDFAGTERTLIDETIILVECYLLLVDYFLGPQDLLVVTKEKWGIAVHDRGEDLQDFKMSKANFQAIKARIQSFRSRLCKTCSEAGTGLLKVYGLEGLPQGSPEAIKVIDSLLPHGAHLKPGSKPGYGFFQHDFIFKVIYQILFGGRHPLAQAHPDLFRKFPPHLVTLTTSIIHGILEKYKLKPHKGNKTKDDQLLLPEVLSYYKIHRKTMKLFASEQEDRFEIVMSLLHKRCFERAGIDRAAPTKPKKIEVLTASHFARDEPTEEERMALGLPRKATKTTTSGPSHSHSNPPTSSVDQQSRSKSKAPPAASLDASSDKDHAPKPNHLAPSSPPTPPQIPPDPLSAACGAPNTTLNLPTQLADQPSAVLSDSFNYVHAVPASKALPVTSPIPTPPNQELVTGSDLVPNPSATKSASGSIKSASMSKSPLRRTGLVVELNTKPTKKGPASLRNAGGHIKAGKPATAGSG
ncbi:unnamed protein product [Rhizoctonia solani]|uniref:DUF6532 domain-containing protein n=1 Tax=Rhizoctonia solani TaxID=456999 RepID=A0A8H3BKG0_9AGAM|nr:unnamed protein product [Rhizoctonia solani]